MRVALFLRHPGLDEQMSRPAKTQLASSKSILTDELSDCLLFNSAVRSEGSRLARRACRPTARVEHG